MTRVVRTSTHEPENKVSRSPGNGIIVGAWRSPVAHSLGVRVVGRSNRLTPTMLVTLGEAITQVIAFSSFQLSGEISLW